MVYMNFPNALTEEEKHLQKKYAELRKKKKILATLRAQKKPEAKEPNKEALKRAKEDAAVNTEQAKKLIKSGAIKLGVDKKDTQTFKRSKRQKDTEKSAVGFQPFSPNHSSETEDETRPEVHASMTPSHPKVKNLYESFVMPRDKPPRVERGPPREPIEAPKKGNTVHVFGHGITEEIVRRAFSNYGRIVNINMEREKNCGFITFDKMESSDRAISELHNAMVSEVKLRVSMARRQPTFEAAQDQSVNSWSTIAASSSQKGGHKDKRDLVVHDADDIF